jgi:IclR family mhp operon transcriptional activator
MSNGVPIRSVSRSLSVLKAINHHGALSLKDIAAYEDLPYPTAFRIVQTLIHEGLIACEADRKYYRPTSLVRSLSNGYEPLRFCEKAQPYMSSLTQDIGWPVFVSSQIGSRMVVQSSTAGETTLTYGPCHPGSAIPLFTSGTGYAYMGHLPNERQEQMIGWGKQMSEWGDGEVDESSLRFTLADVRQKGFCARPCMNKSANRTASIAVPLYENGEVSYALTLTYFAVAMKQSTAIERYMGKLMDTAQRISN